MPETYSEGWCLWNLLYSHRDFLVCQFSVVINGALEEFFPPGSGVQIIAEPGRYFVDSAFTLAANVIAKRVIEEHKDEHNGNG